MARKRQLSDTEPYAGFLIVPEDSTMPTAVRPPAGGTLPSMEDLADNSSPASPAPHMAAPAGPAEPLPFPMYTLSPIPAGLEATPTSIVRNDAGAVSMAGVSFERETYWMDRPFKGASISISAMTEYPRAVPLLVSRRGPPSGRMTVRSEPVSYLPAPGVRLRTARGAVFHWIENDVLYTLQVENDATTAEAAKIARSLVVAPR